MGLAFTMAASVTLSGCGTGKKDSGKTEIELVQYKPEAVKAFEKLEEKFNATHADGSESLQSMINPTLRSMHILFKRSSDAFG